MARLSTLAAGFARAALDIAMALSRPVPAGPPPGAAHAAPIRGRGVSRSP